MVHVEMCISEMGSFVNLMVKKCDGMLSDRIYVL